MTIPEAGQLHGPLFRQKNSFQSNVSMGYIVFMEKGERTEYLSHKTVGFKRRKRPGATEELVKIATCAVRHDQAKLGSFIVKKVDNREDIRMPRVQVGELDRGTV